MKPVASFVQFLAIILAWIGSMDAAARAQRQMEHLARGLVCVCKADGTVFLGWRLLATDPEQASFDVVLRHLDGRE
jgi:rhamnogalacturonan endolyase